MLVPAKGGERTGPVPSSCSTRRTRHPPPMHTGKLGSFLTLLAHATQARDGQGTEIEPSKALTSARSTCPSIVASKTRHIEDAA